MAIYHDIEEMNYGPLLGMPAKVRVLLCIRHKLLRDGLCEKVIGKKFIVEKTGLGARQVERAIKYWEKREYILVHQSKTGKVWNENSYELHPKKFGHLYNWYKNNPTVRVYTGSKGKSFSQKGIPELPVPLPVNLPGGVVSDFPGGKARNLSELFAEIRSKNPSFNNPKKKNPISIDLKSSGKRDRTQEEHEAMVREQIREAKAGRI